MSSLPATLANAYFQAIGLAMQERLGNHANPDDVFAGIASAVLREFEPPRIDVLTMADWTTQQRPLPKQVNFHSGFGQPPLVVFEDPQFYIEVLFWFPSRTSIHGHGFTGAFRVLDGYSIQVEYQFIDESSPEHGIRLGHVQTHGIEMISEGKISTILGRDGFIHTVAHMGNPSLTLVARTKGHDELKQFTFHRCGFAYLSHYNAKSISRQADVLLALFQARPSEFTGRFVNFLRNADTATFFKVLEHLAARLGLPTFHREILPAVREEFAESKSRALAALDDSIRTSGLWAMIPGFKDPKKQLLLVLGELFTDESERDAAICRSYGTGDASAILESWMQIADRVFTLPAAPAAK